MATASFHQTARALICHPLQKRLGKHSRRRFVQCAITDLLFDIITCCPSWLEDVAASYHNNPQSQKLSGTVSHQRRPQTKIHSRARDFAILQEDLAGRHCSDAAKDYLCFA